MASYGKQQSMDVEFLRKYGFFGRYVPETATPFGARHWHPIEVGLLHGVIDRLFLPNDKHDSWMLLGNCISSQHALLLVANGISKLGTFTFDMHHLFAEFHDRILSTQSCRIAPNEHGFFLIPREHMIVSSFLEAANVLRTDHSGHQSKEVRGYSGFVDSSPQISPPAFTADHLGMTASPISVESSPEFEETLDFQPMLQGVAKSCPQKSSFWYSANLPASVLEQSWGFHFHCTFDDQAIPHTAILSPRQNESLTGEHQAFKGVMVKTSALMRPQF